MDMLFGGLIGAIIMGMISIFAMHSEEKKESKEEFVKKLIELKGWEGARWELQFAFKNKYMKTWCKLYKEHLMKEEEDNEQ